MEERLVSFARLATPRVRRARVRRIALLSSGLLVAGAGGAAAVVNNYFRVGGVEIERIEGIERVDQTNDGQATEDEPLVAPLQAPETPMLPGNASVWPGEPVTVEEAARRHGQPVRLPRVLRAPKAVFWMVPPRSGQITSAWSPSRTLPPMADRTIGLLLTQFRGSASADPAIMKKVASTTTKIENVVIRSGKRRLAATWISGEVHIVQIVDEDGGVRSENSRLAGNTLLWTDGPFTFRLEGRLVKAEALRIAASVR